MNPPVHLDQGLAVLDPVEKVLPRPNPANLHEYEDGEQVNRRTEEQE